MKPFLKSVIVITLLLLFFPVEEVSAQASNFVPCDGEDCSACDFVSMINVIIKWLFGMIFVIFAVMMTTAGFGLVTSGGSQSALEAAKSKFQNAIIGIIIVMAGWLIVDTVMRGTLDGGTGEIAGFGPWSEVKCQVQAVAFRWEGDPDSVGTADPSVTATSTSLGPRPTGCSGGTCVPLGIPCANSASCSISPDLVARFQAFHAAAGVSGARVTEAMPPTRTHKSACHKNGTCVDYSKSGGMTAAEVISTINAASANGLRPVYEVITQAQKDSLVAAGASASNIKVLGSWISAPHFSIYGY